MIESLTLSDSPVRLAMVGLGPQGHEHLHAARLSKQVTFVAAVDPNPQARAAAIHRFPQLTSGTFDCLQPLREMELDGLVLALPHHAYQHMWSDLLAFKLPMLTVGRWENGVMVEEWLYWDNQAFMKQVGLAP